MTQTLVRDPIYQQLNQALRNLISSGAVKPGEQFLTERQVGERFAVSRATANKALSNLVSEGILEFRKGVGTFVRAGVLNYDLRALVSFTDKAAAAGKKPATRVLAFDTRAGTGIDPEAARALDLPADGTCFYIERLRLVDGEPVILERRHVAAGLCPTLSRRDAAGSLYAAWTERLGLRIAGAEQTIQAENLNARDAKALGARRGAAALLVVCVGRTGDGAALWHERTLYRGDRYAFETRMGGLQSARPAVGVFYEAS